MSGKQFRAQQRTVGSTAVMEQSIAPGGRPTYWIWAPSQACAGGKYFLALQSTAIATKSRIVEKLWITNTQIAVIASGTSPATVGMIEIQVLRVTAIVGGTATTPNPVDTNDPALTNFTAVYSPTSCTDSTVLFSWFTNNDEVGITGDIWQATLQNFVSTLVEDPWGKFKPVELQPGEGLAVKMITNFTLGSFGVLAVVTEDV
jgi:hypothetical protein